MDSSVKWDELTLAQQMVNIGTEVRRAINAEKKGNDERMKNECLAAVNLIALSIADARNIYRREEFLLAQRVLVDRFFGGNTYGSTAEQITGYYDAFISAI